MLKVAIIYFEISIQMPNMWLIKNFGHFFKFFLPCVGLDQGSQADRMWPSEGVCAAHNSLLNRNFHHRRSKYVQKLENYVKYTTYFSKLRPARLF